MKYILFFVLFSISLLAWSQNSVPKPIATIADTSFNEAKAYKMLYENQVKANDGILKTIFYALGGLGTAILLVFGSNWWFNDKKVKDVILDIDKKIGVLKNELLFDLNEKFNTFSTNVSSNSNEFQVKIQEEITELSKESATKFSSFIEKIRLEIKEDKKAKEEILQKQITELNENNKQQIKTYKEGLTEQISGIKEILNSKHESLEKLLESEQNTRSKENNNILQKLLRVEFYMWADSGVYRNAFASLLEEIEVKLKIKSEKADSYTLAMTQVSEILDKCSYILVMDKIKIDKILPEVPGNDEIKLIIGEKVATKTIKENSKVN